MPKPETIKTAEVDIESISSFEEFRTAVKEAAVSIEKRRLLIHEVDPFSLDKGELEIVENIPEFKHLIELERELIAAGATRAEIKKYGDLYKRARRVRDSMLDDLNAEKSRLLERHVFRTPNGGGEVVSPGEKIYEAAEALLVNEGLPGDIVKAILRAKLQQFEAEVERLRNLKRNAEAMPKLEGEFGEEYQAAWQKLDKFMQAETLKVKLGFLQEDAKEMGFGSVEEMGSDAERKLRELKDKLGENDFSILAEMNRRSRRES